MMKRSLTVKVDGVALNVERRGYGDPVVCLHAVGHDGNDFAPLADRLGDGFEFISVDWPSQGLSGHDHLPASAARYAELLDGLIAQLNIAQPIIIGNSIGGAVAVLFASRHPIRGLVLCDSGGLVEITPDVVTFCRLHERFFAAGERGAWWYGPIFALYYRVVLPSPAAKQQRKRIIKAAKANASVLRQVWASFGKRDADIRDVAASLDTPIWAAWAQNDRIVPLKRCLPTIRRLQRHTLSVFKGGHAPFLEQPDAFAEGFKAFAASLPLCVTRPMVARTG